MKAQELQALAALIQHQAAEFKEVFAQVKAGAEQFQPEFEEVKSFLANTAVDVKSKMFNGFIEKGFSREEALTLTADSFNSLKQAAIKVKK